jgi:hypothetical protein
MSGYYALTPMNDQAHLADLRGSSRPTGSNITLLAVVTIITELAAISRDA